MVLDVDQNDNGMIEFNEFLQMMSKKMREGDSEDELKEAFKWVYFCLCNWIEGIKFLMGFILMCYIILLSPPFSFWLLQKKNNNNFPQHFTISLALLNENMHEKKSIMMIFFNENIIPHIATSCFCFSNDNNAEYSSSQVEDMETTLFWLERYNNALCA